MRRPPQRLNARIVLATLTVSTVVFGVFVLWLTILRESPMFWTYRSPYPIWFRDLARYAYFPCFGAYFFATAMVGYALSTQNDHRIDVTIRVWAIGSLWAIGLAILIAVTF